MARFSFFTLHKVNLWLIRVSPTDDVEEVEGGEFSGKISRRD